MGGYLVIEGRLSLGALVAVLAAYKEFSTPLRELFKYYQNMEDVRVRYDELRAYFDRIGQFTSVPSTQQAASLIREQTAVQPV